MKKRLLLIGALAIGMANAQVTTITPEIKGSGGLSLDAEGNLYIGDFGDYLSMPDDDGLPNKVYKLDTEGNLTVYAEGFAGASGNAFNSEGILFQADIGASTIYKIVDGVPEVFATENISAPVGLVFDSEDNLYVCNCGSNTIAQVTPEGVSTIYSSDFIFSCPNGITIDHDGILYVSNFSNGRVIRIENPDAPELLATVSGSNNGHLRYCAADSNLYVCSHGASAIYRVGLDGEIDWFAGSGTRGNDDGDWDVATFSRPNGIVFTPDGDTMYVNSSIPVTDVGLPLNPSVIRRITGVKTGVLKIDEVEAQLSNVSIYPNPSTDGPITVKIHDGAYMRLYAIDGSFLLQENFQDDQLTVDLSNQPKGKYLLEIHLKNGAIGYEKLIKAD